MADPNDHAITALVWAQLATRSLSDAIVGLAGVGYSVSRDIARGDTDFATAKAALDDAWAKITSDALKNIARAREALSAAEDAAIEQARAGEGAA